MADFLIDTDELRLAAEQLRWTATIADPRSGQLTVGQAALGSNDVYDALNSGTVQQAARAASLARGLRALATVLANGADAVEQHDEDLADRLER